MFRHVMVGIDGEASSRDALALARLLLAGDGRLTLAHIYPGDAYTWRGTSPAYSMVEEQDAQALLERVRKEEKLEAELEYRGNVSVGRGLHVLAEEVGADVLVLGSSRQSLLHRVMVGADTRAALNGAPCAVAIAPAGYASDAKLVREIGVGYNGSQESGNAIAVARELAAQYGAKLSAFEAVSVPTFLVHGRAARGKTPVDDLVEGARERIAELDGVEPHAAYGEPAEELTLYSASLDLLVIGSRDYGPIGRLMHGSTSHRLAHSARCPLLVLTKASRKARAMDEEGESEAQTALAAHDPA